MQFVSKPEKVKVMRAEFPCVVKAGGYDEPFNMEEGDALVLWPVSLALRLYKPEQFAQAFEPEKKTRVRHRQLPSASVIVAAGGPEKKGKKDGKSSEPTPGS